MDEWDNPMNARFPRFTGWRFDNPWELVPGTWRIELLHQERAIASQEFEVTVESRRTREQSPARVALPTAYAGRGTSRSLQIFAARNSLISRWRGTTVAFRNPRFT